MTDFTSLIMIFLCLNMIIIMTYKELKAMGRRVVTSKAAPTVAAMSAAPGTPAAAAPSDTYVTKLIKYIPSEIVAVYIFIEGILNSMNAAGLLQWIIFAFLLILTPIYMWRVTHDKTQPPAWGQIIISFFSFAIWVFAMGGPFTTLSWYNPLYGSILVALYTLVIPIIM